MLYRLNLTDEDRYHSLIENNLIVFSELLDSNAEELLNIERPFGTCFKLVKGDYIWTKHKEVFLIAKVKDKGFLDIDRELVLVPVEFYRYSEEMDVLKGDFAEDELEEIDDELLLIKSQGIFIELSNKNRDESTPKNQIQIRKKAEINNKDSEKINIQTKPSNNFGEMIIEVHSPKSENSSKIPATINSKKEIEVSNSWDKFYVEMMKSQMELFAKMQPISLDEFFKMQKKFWEKF